jgi:uncharacterized protein YkwD
MILLFSGVVKADMPLWPTEQHLINVTNQERVKRGLPPYKVDDKCQMAARWSAFRQARSCNMRHDGQWRGGGENVAMNSNNNANVVIRQWLNSSGHRAAMLSNSNTKFGVSVFRSKRNGCIYATQCFSR